MWEPGSQANLLKFDISATTYHVVQLFLFICVWNAGGNYIPSANYGVQVEGHFVTDGVCVCVAIIGAGTGPAGLAIAGPFSAKVGT